MPPMYEPSNPMTGGGTGGGDMPWNPPPISGDRGGTRIPGGPLQPSPLGGGMSGGGRKTGGGQDAGGVLPFGYGRNVGSGPAPNFGTDASMPAGGGMGNRQASMMAPTNSGTGMVQSRGQQDQAARRASQRAGDSGQYQNPNSTARLRNYGTSRPTYASPQGGMNQTPPMSGGRGTYDTGGLSPYGGASNYPRSPGMPTPRTPRRMFNFGGMGGYSSRQPAMTFNQGNTNINNQLTQQGPRIARNMGRMGGYNPMMFGGQSRQIGGLRNLMQMLAAMRGGRR